MAVLWQQKTGDRHYEVRTAGHTRRLYTNGVLHSAFNRFRPITGDVWDLLLIPAFFHRRQAATRVLVLGVGGGAAIRQLAHFLDPADIVGVERDTVHLYIARRFFEVDRDGVTLIEDDAVTWLAHYTGAPFDIIIDDLFGEQSRMPVRAVPADGVWFRCLLRRLRPRGLLVVNFGSPSELRQSGYFTSTRVRNCFQSAFQLSLPMNDNAIGVFSRTITSSAALRRNLLANRDLSAALRTKRLRYRVRSLS